MKFVLLRHSALTERLKVMHFSVTCSDSQNAKIIYVILSPLELCSRIKNNISSSCILDSTFPHVSSCPDDVHAYGARITRPHWQDTAAFSNTLTQTRAWTAVSGGNDINQYCTIF